MKLYLSTIGFVASIALIGCGGGNNSSSNDSVEIDFAKYLFPNKSITKKFINIALENDGSSGDGIWTYSIGVEGDIVKYWDEEGGSAVLTYNIGDTEIVPSYHHLYGDITERYIQKGDTVFSKGDSICKFEDKIQSFTHKYIEYSGDIGNIESFTLSTKEKELYKGDILKIKCMNQDDKTQNISYFYFQKGLGHIASINDCYSEETDTKECSDKGYFYSFYVNDSYLKAIDNKNIATSDENNNKNLDDVVFERNTGLMWQDNIEASNTMKTWLTWTNAEPCYNSGKNCYNTSGDTASSYCKNMRLGGYDDWRLPTIEELKGIKDANREEEPFIKSDFRNAVGNIYWSSNTRENDKTFALVDNFSRKESYDSSTPKGTSAYVRCTRYQGDFSGLSQTRDKNEEIKNSIETKGDFTRDNTREIVIDNKNGWIWQDDKDARLKRKLWLTEENYNNCNGDTSSSSCYDTSGNTATTYCANLTLAGYNDWRLPSKDELLNQVSYENMDIFKNKNYDYWSSTTSEPKSLAYIIYPYLYDKVYIFPKKYKKFVRCIREK